MGESEPSSHSPQGSDAERLLRSLRPINEAEEFILNTYDGLGDTEQPIGLSSLPERSLTVEHLSELSSDSQSWEITSQQHRSFQEKYREKYLQLHDEAVRCADPDEAVRLRTESLAVRSLMYYHIHKAYPQERAERLNDNPWPLPKELRDINDKQQDDNAA